MGINGKTKKLDGRNPTIAGWTKFVSIAPAIAGDRLLPIFLKTVFIPVTCPVSPLGAETIMVLIIPTKTKEVPDPINAASSVIAVTESRLK